MDWKTVGRWAFTFKKPELFIIALVLFSFSIAVIAHPGASFDALGFQLASGFGLFFWMAAAKARKKNRRNYAIWLVWMGSVLITVSFFGTPKDVFASMALTEFGHLVLAAGAGLLAPTDETEEEASDHHD